MNLMVPMTSNVPGEQILLRGGSRLVIGESLGGKEASHASKGGLSVPLSLGLRAVWLIREAKRGCTQPESGSPGQGLE